MIQLNEAAGLGVKQKRGGGAVSMDPNDLSNLVVPLPEDIQRAKDFGDFSLTRRLIHQKLNNARISEVLKDRLQTELKVLTVFEAKAISL